MYSRLCLIAAMALTVSATAMAEPTKPEARAPAKPASRAPELVLASAEQVVTPASDQDQAQPATVSPVKKRAARVTSCRCAGQASPGQ